MFVRARSSLGLQNLEVNLEQNRKKRKRQIRPQKEDTGTPARQIQTEASKQGGPPLIASTADQKAIRTSNRQRPLAVSDMEIVNELPECRTQLKVAVRRAIRLCMMDSKEPHAWVPARRIVAILKCKYGSMGGYRFLKGVSRVQVSAGRKIRLMPKNTGASE